MKELAADPKKSKGPDEWEINNWAETLVKAEEIKADAKKMALIKPLIEKKAKAFTKITSLDQLKEKAKNLHSKNDVESPEEEMSDDEEMD